MNYNQLTMNWSNTSQTDWQTVDAWIETRYQLIHQTIDKPCETQWTHNLQTGNKQSITKSTGQLTSQLPRTSQPTTKLTHPFTNSWRTNCKQLTSKPSNNTQTINQQATLQLQTVNKNGSVNWQTNWQTIDPWIVSNSKLIDQTIVTQFAKRFTHHWLITQLTNQLTNALPTNRHTN